MDDIGDFSRRVKAASIEELRDGMTHRRYSEQKYAIVKSEIERRERAEKDAFGLRQIQAAEQAANAATDTVDLAKKAHRLSVYAFIVSLAALVIAVLTFIFKP